MASLPLPRPDYVYAIKDGDEVVYVGVTRDLAHRMSGHRKTIWYRPEFEVIVLSTHAFGGHIAEVEAIRKYRPKYNIVGNHGVDWRESA